MARLALPRSKRARRIIVIAAVIVLTAGTGIGVAVATRDADTKTPCQAAIDIVKDVRGNDPSIVAYMPTGYSAMLRNLIVGHYEDVEGDASPALAQHLRKVADDLDALYGQAGSGEFITGRTGRDMDALIAYCATE